MNTLSTSLLLVMSLTAGAAAETAGTNSPRFAVGSLRLEWKDTARDRVVPAKIYFPEDATNACAVILFSHGLGGTRESYEYLGREWAGHGYVSVHLQHPGSDDAVWRDATNIIFAMREAGAKLANSENRPRDVSFAIDQLAALNRDAGPLQGRLDTNRIGVAGHSFGAFTALAIAGEVFELPFRDVNFADPRVKAAIVMSAPVPMRRTAKTFGNIRIPLLHLTGTEDNSTIGNTTARDRRIPFDSITQAEQFIVTFNGGDHMVFAGRAGVAGARPRDEKFQALIRRATVLFLDAYLGGDGKAKAQLVDGGFAKELGSAGTFEKKSPSKAP